LTLKASASKLIIFSHYWVGQFNQNSLKV